MAHLVESLFYTSNEANGRFVPWHGLGTPVQEAPDSSSAIKLAGLDWEVVSNPVFDSNGKEIVGYKANTRSSDNSVLGIVSNRYKIIQNSKAFDFTDSLIEDESIRYETAGSLRNGKQIWLLAQMPTTKVLGDDVAPYICFTNTHDGSGAIRVCLTPIRVVCNNTLNIALSNASRSWSTRHIGDLEAKLIEARETLELSSRYMEELDKEANVLVEKKMTDSDIEAVLDEIFPVDEENDTARKVRNINEVKDAFYVCYMMPDIAKFRGTAWGAVQAMSDLVTHMAPTRKSDTYKENNWGRIINGHPMLDAMVKQVG